MAQAPTKAVIFAGGIGSRMWPLSRTVSPKQFEKIIEGKSTLQLTIERLRPEFDWQDIYISSGERYLDIIRDQLPEIPSKNLIGEPVMRDVAPAVGYAMSILNQDFPDTATVILWSDHLVKNVDRFKAAISAGANYLQDHPDQIVFLGQKPRFASQNLGWIEYGATTGQVDNLSIHKFKSWHYRPNLDTAQTYLNSGRHAWNPGYFVATPRLIMDLYQTHAPQMHKSLSQLAKNFGKPNHKTKMKQIYPKLEKVSFDNLILEKIKPSQGAVISVDLGWSDLGAWEALKEALQASPDQNITHGNVKTKNTIDTLVYSYTDQLVTTIDLEGMIVVVTPDVILVTHKDSVPEVKNLVNELKDSGLSQYT